MTEAKPTPAPSDILVEKTDELSTKTLGLSKSVAETIGKRIRALDVLRERDGVTGDPVRMQAIVDRLFEAADTLIYLAEDVRAAQSRAERTLLEQADTSQPESKTYEETGELHRDEQELLTMLESMEGEPVSVEYLLENGFALSLSSDRGVRKRRLQKCLRSLAGHPLLLESGKVLVKEGQTRGTKYSIQTAVVSDSNQHVTEQEQPLDVTSEDETQLVQPITTPSKNIPHAPPQAPFVEVKRINPLEAIIESTIDTIIHMDQKRPYLCIQDIVRVGFPGKRLEPEVFREIRAIVSNDQRIEHVSNGEYRIIGRDLSEEWVDRRALRIAVDSFIDNMIKWSSTQEDTINLVRAAGRTGMWLTKDERNVLMGIARRDYRVVSVDEDKLVIDPKRTKDKAPDRHLRGMSPLELDKTMAKLGMKNTAPFRRRR